MHLSTNPQMPKRAKRVVCRPDFNFETAYKSAGAVAGLCNWVSAMVTYHNIAKFVAPKTDALLKAEKSLQVANKKLAAAMEDLAICQGELDAMQVNDLHASMPMPMSMPRHATPCHTMSGHCCCRCRCRCHCHFHRHCHCHRHVCDSHELHRWMETHPCD